VIDRPSDALDVYRIATLNKQYIAYLPGMGYLNEKRYEKSGARNLLTNSFKKVPKFYFLGTTIFSTKKGLTIFIVSP